MRTSILLVLASAALLAASPPVDAAREAQGLRYERALPPGEQPDHVPLRSLIGGARAETTWFGSYEVIEGEYYALSGSVKEEVMWTFDRGNGPFPPPTASPARVIPDGEGWKAIDMTEGPEETFRAIDGTLDLGDLPGGGPVPPPIISGSGSLWVGVTQPEAEALCWLCGAGYGTEACTRIFSPVLAYDGSGDVTLAFRYFNDSEPCYDGTQVYLRRDDGDEVLLNPYPSGTCENNETFDGGFTDRIGTFDANGVVTAFAHFERAITAAEIAGSLSIQIVIEFISDPGGWSDEDCEYPTVQGPFGADDLTLTSNLTEGDVAFDWEDGLQGWTAAPCAPIGDFVDIADVADYTILDPCGCQLSDNVLEMHDGTGQAGTHPDGQHVQILGPICRLPEGLKQIGIDFDMYAELPQANGVFIRPGALYYPHECPTTGVVGWSARVGQDNFEYTGADPICFTWRYSLTDVDGVPVPPDAELMQPILELLSSCEAFAINPCTPEYRNATPIFDNIAVWSTPAIHAPKITFDFLTQFIDNGSYPSSLLDLRAAVPANVAFDKHGNTQGSRDLLGDSLVIVGPVPGNDPNRRWEARMWWRVARRGPFQADKENNASTRYKLWKDRVSKGNEIDRPYHPVFTWGWMDSAQTGPTPHRNKFKSNYRENESQFLGETNPETEMIWDDALRPGTRIEYFITSNYVGSPNELYYYPDTLGGNLFEFEALPGIRVVNIANCGGAGFNYCAYHPATLYVDAYNAGAQVFIENALRTVLNGLDPCTAPKGCPIPYDRNWDRYDYTGSSTGSNAGIGRGSVPGSNNGFTLNQILGYRAILVNTGVLGEGSMEDSDFALFDAWLTSPDCSANVNRQVFIMNGDNTGELLESPGNGRTFGPAFLANTLGASLFCDNFNGITIDPDCAPDNSSYCVRLLPEAGGPFGTSTEVDAFGNWCPNMFSFNVFSPNGGVGNRTYSAEDPPKVMSFAQIANENLGAGANYRSVLDGVSYHHMTARNAGGAGESLCPRDLGAVVEAAIPEIRAALRWGFGVADDGGIPKLTAVEDLLTCQGTWSLPADLADGAAVRVNRLYPNEPNPFNPRTTIRFSLAQPGEVQLLIYDVNGRLVRTLLDGKKDAGQHTAVWDGTNDEGHRIGSGVYWSQMKAGSFVSSKKMVVLK